MRRCFFFVIVLLVAATLSQGVQAQTSSKTTEGGRTGLDFGQFDIRDLFEKAAIGPTLPVVPLEQTIDPLKYVVGPSDIFSINVWIGTGFSFQSSVTPEGTLIIPTVGEMKVAGTTLAEAKGLVTDRVRRKYSKGDITVTLLSPRTFIVYVTGLVFREGPYVVTATTRVGQVVRLAGAPPDTAFRGGRESGRLRLEQRDREDIRWNASRRNVLVRRKDGSTIRADLAMYYGTGSEACNPPVLDGDIIFVPRRHTEEHFVRVSGAVTVPDVYEFVDGDSLVDAIAVAGGLSPLADSSFVELVRINETSTESSSTRYDLREVFAGRQPNVPLERGDRVVVHQQVVLNKDFWVEIEGEVRYPGVYPITKNTTKLSDVIKMAGGFTEHAYIEGGTVIREEGNYDFSEVSPDFEKLLFLRSQRSEPWDSTYYFLDSRLKKRLVSTDFERLFNDHDPSQDVLLYTGDYIYVPSMKRMVYVHGQVVNPGYVPWVEGMDYRHYIRRAGGFSEKANKGDTRVIKGRTLEWMKPGSTEVEVGDNIYVPSKEKRTFRWYVVSVSQGAAIVGAILGSIALILQINK